MDLLSRVVGWLSSDYKANLSPADLATTSCYLTGLDNKPMTTVMFLPASLNSGLLKGIMGQYPQNSNVY